MDLKKKFLNLGMANYHINRGCSPFKINFESTESSASMIFELDHSLVKAHGKNAFAFFETDLSFFNRLDPQTKASLMLIAWVREQVVIFFQELNS